MTLPNGNSPIEWPAGNGSVLLPPCAKRQAAAPEQAIADALDTPCGDDLAAFCAGKRHLAIIVSDESRHEPRAEMLQAILSRLPKEQTKTLFVATGTHQGCRLKRLNLPKDLLGQFDDVVVHDGHAPNQLDSVGETAEGTPVVLNSGLLTCDGVILTGLIKPHYFAGFSGGYKSLFPGLGGNDSIRTNHRLKSDPSATIGRTKDNRCLLDMAAAASLVGKPMFLLNVIGGIKGRIHGATAGEVADAHHRGVELATELWQVPAICHERVIASDEGPIAESLYQACKIFAAAAPFLKEAGELVVFAPCSGGIEPLETIISGIFDIGIEPRLPAGATLRLASSLPEELVDKTFCEPFHQDMSALSDCLVLPYAAHLLQR